ncbi:PigN-domain-containing protein [Dentipellis sp. KUC8613]|nr:PigN-domain-containing protein [Dentipellis sp. KUC8613]
MTEFKGYSIARLLVLGLVFHLIYIGTVFDCYFTSPVVHGMRPYAGPRAQAKRLVLIVGDGLRADFVFSANATAIVPEADERVAPYLRNVIETRGAYGVSHTRVPTESRPGHVAIIGGMYEDVSAVTKGWKTNPVNFDSVFNQSTHTFSFGSPDILPMFARGATPGKVRTWCYDEEDEDFTKDATALDIWVLDQLRMLLHNATTDDTLDAELRQDGVVFFLHLLGLDTTGHSYRPHSKEYMKNIQIVDTIVRDTEALLSAFYGDDDETSFIFTADHGMSRIGNHGDGDPDNTRTPLIAWGAGVRGPLPSHPAESESQEADAYAGPWGLAHLARRDVEQADVAALMSALLGTPWPVNSVGVLPDVDPAHVGFLDMKDGEEGVARAGVTNAKVILEHYRVKHELKKRHALFYQPYPGLAHTSTWAPGSTELALIEKAIAAGHYRESRYATRELLRTILQGLRYLETYDRTLIRSIVSAAYTGWIAYATAFILAPPVSLSPSKSSSPSPSPSILTILAGATVAAFWTVFAIEKAPWTFFVYVVFPVFFWHGAIARVSSVKVGSMQAGVRVGGVLKAAGTVLGAAGVLQCMVFGYTHRAIWSLGFVLIGAVWPLAAWPREVVRTHSRLLGAWAAACVATAAFPLLRVDPEEGLTTILAGGSCMLVAGALGWWVVMNAEKNKEARSALGPRLGLQVLLIGLSMAVTASSVSSLQAKRGLPLFNQVVGWIILVVASAYPFVHRPAVPLNTDAKLLTHFLAFCPCFVILSIRAEGLFYLAYCATLYLWVRVEEVVRGSARAKDAQNDNAKASGERHGGVKEEEKGSRWNRYGLCVDDVRVALVFLFFVQVGFFGTGNVASISSFYLEPVYRLVPIFNPFLMASLLIFKILAPYVQLSACFALLTQRLGMPPFALFLVALALTDGMTMTFFFNVTDTGSWLQIGQSISHFCITSLLLVFSAGIAAAGEHLMQVEGAGRVKASKSD